MLSSPRSLTLSAAAFIALCAGALLSLALQGGEPAPALDSEDPNGMPFSLDAQRGSGVVINFWATWCAPCVREMPALQRAHEALEAHSVQVWAVNVGESPAAIQRFAERHQLDLPLILDQEGTISDAWQVRTLPITFLVNATGEVVGRESGEREWDKPSMIDHLKTLAQ